MKTFNIYIHIDAVIFYSMLRVFRMNDVDIAC